MSLLQQLFQLHGDAPAKPKTMGDLAAALRASDAAAPAPAATEADAASTPPPAKPQGPCLEDPGLPPLNLQPTADAAPDAAVVLGTPPEPVAPREQPAFIQVMPRPPRFAPLVAVPPAPVEGKFVLQLSIACDPAIDVDAVIRHVASFPGVDECHQTSDDAHD